MIVAKKICQRLFFCRERFASRWRAFVLKLSARMLWTESFQLESGCTFGVPLSIRGSMGCIRIGAHSSFGYYAAPKIGNGEILLQARSASSLIAIGRRGHISNNISVIACTKITIGDEFFCGDGCLILDSDFHEIDPLKRSSGSGKSAAVMIGNNVWLGSRVTVLKGVVIGDNCVIAANSVVTRSVPPNSIAAGNPAKVIRALKAP